MEIKTDTLIKLSIGLVVGGILNVLFSYQFVNIIPISVIALLASLIVSVYILSNISKNNRKKKSEILSKIFTGIAIISLVFSVYSFVVIAEGFVSNQYMNMNIGAGFGGPIYNYPPDLIFGGISSSFLTGLFAVMERYVTWLEKSKSLVW